MKKAISFVLCLVLILSVVSTALAVPMTESVTQQQKAITPVPTTVVDGKTIPVVVEDTVDPGWTEEIVVTPVTVIKTGKEDIGGNLEDNTGGLDKSSKQKVYDILDAAFNAMKNNDSYYNLTKDRRYDRDDLRLCNLFEVTYAWKNDSQHEYKKMDYTGSAISLTFNGITEHVVSVLHKGDSDTYWRTMQFEQSGDRVTVHGFDDFSPVAFITIAPSSTEPGLTIQPTGGGGGTPTSPQTGEVPAGYALCALTAAAMAGCLYVRSRKEKRA